MPFDIKNISIENGEAEAHTKIGWWRWVSNIPHGFEERLLILARRGSELRDEGLNGFCLDRAAISVIYR